MIPTIKISLRKFRVNDALVAFVFISYFCSEALRSFVAQVIMQGLFNAAYFFVFWTCIFLYIIVYNGKRLLPAFLCYSIISALFIITFLIHPEYESWYFERTYGIQVQFLRATGGIWAFLVLSLEKDRESMLEHLRFVAWLMFIYLSLRFLNAQIRGYWISYDNNYLQYEGEYSLGFGYDLLLPVLFFAAEAYLNRKRLCYIPFILGTIEILFGGSRGAIIWIPFIFIMMLPCKWKTMTKKKRVLMGSFFAFAFLLAIFIYLYYDVLLRAINQFLLSKGFQSRTLLSLLSGEFLDGNGRNEIYAMVIERIKEGGFFGNGVFGERIVVGQKFRWGYAHNFFLELFAAFGYVGGTLISLWLVFMIIRTIKKCRSTTDYIVFLTFFCSSMKLLLSDSFWFNRSFWALIAIMILWQKQSVDNDVQISSVLWKQI